MRTDRHIATLIQTLEPYVPSLDRNHGNDRYSVSLFLVPLDNSRTRLIPLRSGLAPDGFGLAKVLGSDGRTLWFNVAGIGGVDLDNYKLRTVSTGRNLLWSVDTGISRFGLQQILPGEKSTAFVGTRPAVTRRAD